MPSGKQLVRQMLLTYGAQVPYKGDPTLYVLAPGVSSSQIDDETHEQTILKYREWKAQESAANELRGDIRTLVADLHKRDGPLLSSSAWRDEVNSFRKKYLDLISAYRTRLPLSLRQFQRQIGVQMSTEESYKKLITDLYYIRVTRRW